MRRITKIYAFLFALIMVLSAAPLLNASALSTNYLLLDLIIKKPTDISTCTIAVAKSVSYTGKALKPKVTVKNGKTVLKEGTHYTLKYSSNKKIGTGKVTVTGIDNKGYKNSKTISFKILPKKPKVTAKNKTTTSFTLSWKKVKGAKKYYIYKYDTKKKKYVKAASTKKTSYTVKKLSSAKKYQYAVKAYAKKNYLSDYSKITVYTNPSAVKSLKAKASDTTTALSWKKVKGATGYIIYSYNAKTKKYTKVGTTKKRSYTVKNLKTKTSYKYAVSAYVKKTSNTGAKKSVSFKTTALVPLSKVKNLKATVKDTAVTLSWSKTDKAEGYYVYTKDEKGKNVLLAAVSTNSFTANRPEGKEESFSVCAFKNADGKKVKGKLSDKLKVFVPFAKVEGLKVKAVSSSSVTLLWNKKETADGYSVYLFDKEKNTYKHLSDAGKSTEFEVKNLKKNTEYTFAVCAYSTLGSDKKEGSYSDTVTAKTVSSDISAPTTVPDSTTKPSTTVTPDTTKAPEITATTTKAPETTAPTTTKKDEAPTSKPDSSVTTSPTTEKPTAPNAPVTISLDDRTETSITIKWSTVRSADYYIVYSFDMSTNTYTKLASTKENTYTASNLQKGKAYSFSVTAVKKTSEGDLESEKSYPGSFSTFPAPAKVTGVNASVSGSKATVSWKALSDADGYTVYSMNPSDGSLTALGTAEGKNQFTFDISEGKAYTVAVKAFVKSKSAFLEGPASESVYVIRPFTKVTNLKVTSKTEYSVTLSWDKKNGAEGYDIFAYDPESKTFSQILDAGTNTSFSVKSLEDNKSYSFAVGAYFTHDNQKITGNHSDAVTVKTNPYIEPSNINVTAYTVSSMSIKWQAVPDAKGYNIYSYNPDTKEYTLLGSSRFALFNASGLEKNKNYSFAVSVIKYENGKDVESNKSDPVTACITTDMPQNMKNAYGILRSNCFSMKYAVPVSGVQSIPTEYYYKNGSFALVANMSMDGMDFSSRTLYLKDKNEAYILIPMGITGFYAKMSAQELKNEGMDADSLILTLAPDVNTAIPYTVTNKIYDGKNYTCETFVSTTGSVITYYFHNGNLTDVEEIPQRGNASHMNITYLSSSGDDKIFKLPSLFPLGWTKVDM